MRKWIGTAAMVGGLTLAGGASALAQDDFTQPTAWRRGPGTEHLRTPMGTSLQLGGGVTNFTSQATRNFTNVGGYWDARAVIGTRSVVGMELAYVGNAMDIRSPGLDTGAFLAGNGAEALVRVQGPFTTYNGVLVEPFAFGGIGWTHYNVVNDDFNVSAVKESDDVGTVPFGAGLAVGYRGLMLDARFTYRQAFDDELFPVVSESGLSDLQSWAAGMMIGVEM
jgi:hypothetical protein